MDMDAEADCSNSTDAKQIYLSNLQEPVVLCKVIVDWESTNWTPDVLGELLANEKINFRIGKQSNDGTFEFLIEFVWCDLLQNQISICIQLSY